MMIVQLLLIVPLFKPIKLKQRLLLLRKPQQRLQLQKLLPKQRRLHQQKLQQPKQLQQKKLLLPQQMLRFQPHYHKKLLRPVMMMFKEQGSSSQLFKQRWKLT